MRSARHGKPSANKKHLISAAGALRHVVMDIIGPLSETKLGKQYFLVFKACKLKPSRSISVVTLTSTSMTVAPYFLIIVSSLVEYMRTNWLKTDCSYQRNCLLPSLSVCESHISRQLPIIQKQTANWNDSTLSEPASNVSLLNIRSTGASMCSHWHMHKIHKCIGRQVWFNLAWSCLESPWVLQQRAWLP